MEVFRKTSEISKQCFPLTLDLDNPKFKRLLDRMVANTHKIAESRAKGGLFQKVRRGFLMMDNALTFGRLYLIRPIPHELPADFRLVPSY